MGFLWASAVRRVRAHWSGRRTVFVLEWQMDVLDRFSSSQDYSSTITRKPGKHEFFRLFLVAAVRTYGCMLLRRVVRVYRNGAIFENLMARQNIRVNETGTLACNFTYVSTYPTGRWLSIIVLDIQRGTIFAVLSINPTLFARRRCSTAIIFGCLGCAWVLVLSLRAPSFLFYAENVGCRDKRCSCKLMDDHRMNTLDI
jgi:hypothetical protein